jgi:hypothetical protein
LKEKQNNYELLTSCSVPCLRRAASIEEEYEAAGGEILLDNEENDGWLATHGKPKGTIPLVVYQNLGRTYILIPLLSFLKIKAWRWKTCLLWRL